MLKSISLIALSFSLTLSSSAAFAAVSPLPLLIEQCLQLQVPVLEKATEIATSVTTAPQKSESDELLLKGDQLEAGLLSLFNIKDRLEYYKHFSLPPLYQESLLQCQLHLADLMSETINSPWLFKLNSEIEKHSDSELTQLKIRLSHILTSNLNLVEKSQLHTAQASIKKGLRDQKLTLKFHNTDCQLSRSSNKQSLNDKTDKNFNMSIASYLIKQNDPVCQKQVWQAYQGRAKGKNSRALLRIKQLKTQQALDNGYLDYSTFALKNQFLSSPTLVKQFLDSQTSTVQIPPWGLGQQLSKSPKSAFGKLDTEKLLTHIQEKAQTLGFEFEAISTESHRVWSDGRLLGDIYINVGKRSQGYTLRHPVLGRQFGQIHVTIKEGLNSYSDKRSFIEVYASALAALSASSHYYLVNTLGETIDTSDLGKLWLTLFLSDGILTPATQNSRESIVDAFSRQQKVFRSKVALNFYASASHKPYEDLREAFSHSFVDAWDKPTDYPYNFYALVSSGPLYYQELWQHTLSNFIFVTTKHCKDQRSVYNTLLVNEDSLSLNQRLRALIGDPVDASSLIKRIDDDFSYSEKYSKN